MGSDRSALTAAQRFYKYCSHRIRRGTNPSGVRILWPVGLGAAFHTKQDGPQARGYSFTRLYFLGDGGAAGLGAFAAPAGAGVGAGLASSSSTSKIRVELAARSGLTDLSP